MPITLDLLVSALYVMRAIRAHVMLLRAPRRFAHNIHLPVITTHIIIVARAHLLKSRLALWEMSSFNNEKSVYIHISASCVIVKM